VNVKSREGVRVLLYIDRTTCSGCRTCLDVCPTGAISLDESEGVAMIDAALCDECLACLDVCPTDAIQRAESSDLVPVLEREVVEGEVIGREVIPAPEAGRPITTRRPSQLAALAGTALSVVGSWLLPRATDALVGAVERRLTQGEDSAPSTTTLRSGSQASMRRMGGGGGGRPRQRRRRQRGR
jgi:Fe-S-cluster-containing hydrogenase component 2